MQRPLLAVLIGALASTAACEDPAQPAAGASEPADPVEHRGPPITFAACTDDPDYDCGTLEVPVDYDHPHGAKLDLGVIRGKATGPGTRLGSLFINQGGPGGSGVSFLMIPTIKTRLALLRERFDIVSFDPRGVELSEPAVHCDFTLPPAPIPGDPASRAQYLDEYATRFAEACVAQTGPAVTKLGTNNVARDLDRFRAALGESRINYLGVSYGSELGAVYASLFPRRVRAMVIDGGVTDTFEDYTMEWFLEEAAAHELGLHHVAELCRRDPSCPITGRGLVDAIDEVLARLRANPVPSPFGGVLTADDAAFGVLIQVAIEARWPRLPAMVAEALANNYTRWFPFTGVVTDELDPTLQIYAAILCTDVGSRRPAADFVSRLVAAEHQFARIGKYAELSLLLRTCHKWPVSDPPIFRNVAGKLDHPLLLVANDFDISTPINWTRHLARSLGMESSLLRYQGGGHTAVSLARVGVPCIDDLARRYLFDLELPPAGFACPAQPIVFTPPLP
jgi:pimeloyl-ACP methyl ester carboxylesterase